MSAEVARQNGGLLVAPTMDPSTVTYVRYEGGWALMEGNGWVADCPAPWCRNAKLVERGDLWVCDGAGGCGHRAQIFWPTLEDQAKILRALSYRPDPYTRNWLPGETPEFLVMEGITHGANLVEIGPDGTRSSDVVLDITGDNPRVRFLDEPHVAVGSSAEQPAIGG